MSNYIEKSLTPDQIGVLSDLIKIAGIEIEVSTLNEASKEWMRLSSKELEKFKHGEDSVVIKIDRGILDTIPSLVEQYRKSAGWYLVFNKTIYKMLNDNDATLFLVMLAVTSANTQLDMNLEYAIYSYQAIQKDLSSNKELLKEFIYLLLDKKFIKPRDIGSTKKIIQKFDKGNPNNKFKDLNYYKFVRDKMSIGAHSNGINRLMRYYFEHSESVSQKSVVKILSSALSSLGKLNKGDKDIITSYKVYNFALNLLNPDHKVQFSEDLEWEPVTIDTWMIYFFYPEAYNLVKEEKKEFKSKIFSTYRKYMYLGKLVQEQAHKIGLSTYELQSIIWIGTINKYKPGTKEKNLTGALQTLEERLEKNNLKSSDVYKFLKRIKDAI